MSHRMGTAWAGQRSYPWERGQYVGGIETVKVNIMLRIYSNKWHVYASLAILNPSVRTQIDSDIVWEQKMTEKSLGLAPEPVLSHSLWTTSLQPRSLSCK